MTSKRVTTQMIKPLNLKRLPIVMLLTCSFVLTSASLSAPPSPSVGVTAIRQAAATGQLQGRVQLMNRRGTKPARSVSTEDVLVFFVSDDKSAASASHGAAPKYQMATVNKAYTPRVLAIPKGAEVHFPNQDRILHNVFSVSGKNRFDLDLYGDGESRSHSFDESGLVRVFCNVHRDMVGFLWVLDTRFSARPANDGTFSLEGLPLGPGKLTVWHERAEPYEVDVSISSSEQAMQGPIDLRITRPRLPSHTRKDGSVYRTRHTY